MSPFSKFLAGLHAVRSDFNEEMEELIAFAEILSRKHSSLELDENGTFFVTATGTLDEIIPQLQIQLGKLERMKKQKDGL